MYSTIVYISTENSLVDKFRSLIRDRYSESVENPKAAAIYMNEEAVIT